MTLPKFIFGMVLVAVAVSIWSVIDGFSLGGVLLRTVICAVLLQVGYFVYVLVMIGRQGKLPSSEPRDAAKDVAPASSRKITHH